MQPQTVDLSGLKDIHLPPLPSAWPPAPIVWQGAAVIVCAVLLGIFLFWFFRRTTMRRYVLKELVRLEQTEIRPADQATDVLKLMRRAALARYGRVGVADLSGRRWRMFLTEHGASFSPEAAEIIEYGAYLPPDRISKDAVNDLSDSVKNWVGKL